MTNFPTTHGENITFHALLPIHRKILLKPGGLFIQFKQMMIKDFTCFEKNPELCSIIQNVMDKCKGYAMLVGLDGGMVRGRLGGPA